LKKLEDISTQYKKAEKRRKNEIINGEELRELLKTKLMEGTNTTGSVAERYPSIRAKTQQNLNDIENDPSIHKDIKKLAKDLRGAILESMRQKTGPSAKPNVHALAAPHGSPEASHTKAKITAGNLA
jgi:hypothetical protein